MPEQKTWLITGCSSGFGRALAEKVLARGDRLVATARNPLQLQDLKEQYPDTCWLLPLDLSDSSTAAPALRTVLDLIQRIDVLVNNAGYGLLGSLEDCSDEQIRRNIEVNFFGSLSLIRSILPLMRQQKSGHIVNISAAAAIRNYAGFSVYGAAKSALEGLSEGLAAELKPLGVHVTLIQPGPFRTAFITRSLDRATNCHPDYQGTVGKFSAYLDKMNGQQPGDPSKAAEAILRVVDSDTPPLRLVLGKYATDKVERSCKARLRELEAWKEIGLATDF